MGWDQVHNRFTVVDERLQARCFGADVRDIPARIPRLKRDHRRRGHNHTRGIKDADRNRDRRIGIGAGNFRHHNVDVCGLARCNKRDRGALPLDPKAVTANQCQRIRTRPQLGRNKLGDLHVAGPGQGMLTHAVLCNRGAIDQNLEGQIGRPFDTKTMRTRRDRASFGHVQETDHGVQRFHQLLKRCLRAGRVCRCHLSGCVLLHRGADDLGGCRRTRLGSGSHSATTVLIKAERPRAGQAGIAFRIKLGAALCNTLEGRWGAHAGCKVLSPHFTAPQWHNPRSTDTQIIGARHCDLYVGWQGLTLDLQCVGHRTQTAQ